MRDIGAALLAIQQHPDPVATVRVFRGRRAVQETDRWGSWSTLVPMQIDDATSANHWGPVGLFLHADGYVRRLRVEAASGDVLMELIDDPTDADAWQSPVSTTTLTPALNPVEIDVATYDQGALVLVVFAMPGTGIQYLYSGDGGATWTSLSTIAGTSDVWGNLTAYVLSGSPVFSWTVGYTAENAGVYRAKFVGFTGSTWQVVDNTRLGDGWRNAGLWYPAQTAGYPLVAQLGLSAWSGAYSELVRTIYNDAFGSPPTPTWLSGVHVLDRLFGGNYGTDFGGVRLDAAFGSDHGILCTELGSFKGWIAGVSVLRDALTPGDSTTMAEPQPVAGNVEALWESERLHLRGLDVGGRYYVVGDTAVFEGVPAKSVSGTVTPTRFRYDQEHLQSGWIEMHLDPADETAQAIAPGELLTIERAYERDGEDGSESFQALVVSRRWEGDDITVLAYDVLGYLGFWRARRPFVAESEVYNTHLSVLARRLLGRAGIGFSADHAMTDERGVPLALQPGETLLGALARSLINGVVYLTPSGDGDWAVEAVPRHRTLSHSGRGEREPYAYGGETGHPLAWVRLVDDARGFGQFHGLSPRSEGDGTRLGWSETVPHEGLRPATLGVIDSRFGWIESRKLQPREDLDQTENVVVEFRSVANLGLELYSTLTIEWDWLGLDGSTVYRVVRIIETWDRGELHQHVYAALA